MHESKFQGKDILTQLKRKSGYISTPNVFPNAQGCP